MLQDELQNDSTVSSLGSGGSRLLDGNSTYAEILENDIAAFHKAPAGLLCNSGFDANVSLFSCLPQPGDIIIYDELIHASVHDGMRLSRANKCIPFTHNNVASFRDTLVKCQLNENGTSNSRRNVFVAVEAVYSMDGDVAPLQEITELLKEIFPEGNGHLIVDEAHSTGVLGQKGRGLVCQLGLEDKVLTRLHTFGKALACNGAVLLCSPIIRQYLINYARPFIYSTFMSYPALAAIRASYTLLAQGKTEPLMERLQVLMRELHNRLHELQTSLRLPSHLQHLVRVPQARPQSAISYVMCSQSKRLAAYCQSRGFVVRGIVPPTVPSGTDRIRICVHAGNSSEQIELLVDSIRSWVETEKRASEVTERGPSRAARL